MKIYLPAPMPNQEAILQSDARFKVVSCGRRFGKSVCGQIAATMGHGPNDKFKGILDGGHIWWVAPTYGIGSIIWRLFKESLKDVIKDKSEVERRIEIVTGGVIQVKSADNPDSLRGTKLDGFVGDEWAFAHKDAWKLSLRAALSDNLGWGIFISTPKGIANHFYDLHCQAKKYEGWEAFQQPTSKNPLIEKSEIEAAKKELGSLEFSQEFEAQFVAAGSGMFKAEWLNRYNWERNQVLNNGKELINISTKRRFATVDLATSIETTADYTCISAWCVTENRDLYLLDVDRDRIEGPDILPRIRKMKDKWSLPIVGIEKSGFQLSLIQRAKREGLPARELRPDKGKVDRALPATALAERGGLYLPSSAPWLSDFETELYSFPASTKDQVDTLSYAVNFMDKFGVPLNNISFASAARARF